MDLAYLKKSQPSAYDVHVNTPLTNISIAYIQQQSEYKADQAFPVVPVSKQTDRYFSYTKGDWFRDEAAKRAPSAESVGSGFTMTSTDTYSCDIWAFHKDIPDQVRANSDAVINNDRDATEFVTQRLLLSRERQFVTTYLSSGVWDTTYTGGTDFTAWSDFAGSDPVGDVTLGLRTVKTNTGYRPNTLIMGGQVWDKLKDHPDILERIKYTQKGIISQDLVAQVFGVQKILVMDAVYNTGVEGAAVSMSQVLGKYALLCYSAPNPSLLAPTAGYIFAWSGYGGRNAYGITMTRLRNDMTKSDRVEGELAYDMKVISTDLGYLFSGAVA
ncbi:MAG: major capsid protein [Candidatus Marinimicrobia bacterium]|nr:major capsid protein [Candidatus Neomarinimicrobiota bacterium]